SALSLSPLSFPTRRSSDLFFEVAFDQRPPFSARLAAYGEREAVAVVVELHRVFVREFGADDEFAVLANPDEMRAALAAVIQLRGAETHVLLGARLWCFFGAARLAELRLNNGGHRTGRGVLDLG